MVGPRQFRWVYDCGTTSAQQLLTVSLNNVHRHWGGGKPMVNLVVLSHFDYDHISGMLLLLRLFKVETLLLPHVPIEQRLRSVMNRRMGLRSHALRFALDPVAYLESTDGIEVGQVVEVLPADERPSEEATPAPTPDGPVFREDDPIGSLQIPWEKDEPGQTSQSQPSAGTGRNIRTGRVRSGSPLLLGSLWEFLPYNDASMVPKLPARFAAKARKAGANFLKQRTQAALDSLKALYDDEFGKTSAGRNTPSLFLYAGTRATFHANLWEFESDQPSLSSWAVSGDPSGFLYTGDGFLDTQARLKQYLRHLGRRAKGTNCLQVMHHGSRNNWHEGVAQELEPIVSIFSSNPSHRRFQHPHGEVVRDFLRFQPIQVDTQRRASITITFDCL